MFWETRNNHAWKFTWQWLDVSSEDVMWRDQSVSSSFHVAELHCFCVTVHICSEQIAVETLEAHILPASVAVNKIKETTQHEYMNIYDVVKLASDGQYQGFLINGSNVCQCYWRLMLLKYFQYFYSTTFHCQIFTLSSSAVWLKQLH